MKFILGTKQKMTQLFSENGAVQPVTRIITGPVVVTQIKNAAKDGYSAVQVGFGAKHAKHISKALSGHFKDRGNFRFVREFRLPEGEISLAEGDTIGCDIFSVGDVVEVSGTSKGKGFQGVVKRHGFAGGPRTHGQKHSEREAGSIGGSGGRAGGRVAKGMRMAGRMGSDRVTVKNLKVVAVDTEKGEIFLKGALPGVPGSLIEIRG